MNSIKKAIVFLIYALSLSILFLSVSVEKDKTLLVLLGIAILFGFLFSFLVISKICSKEKKISNGTYNEE